MKKVGVNEVVVMKVRILLAFDLFLTGSAGVFREGDEDGGLVPKEPDKDTRSNEGPGKPNGRW